MESVGSDLLRQNYLSASLKKVSEWDVENTRMGDEGDQGFNVNTVSGRKSI